MKKNIVFKTNLTSEKSIKEPTYVQYDYYPGRDLGETFEEDYINLYRGSKHIFIARDYDVDNGSTTPRFCIIESDLKTMKQRLYKVELCEEKTIDEDILFIIESGKEKFTERR